MYMGGTKRKSHNLFDSTVLQIEPNLFYRKAGISLVSTSISDHSPGCELNSIHFHFHFVEIEFIRF